jgi:hypothetical protein
MKKLFLVLIFITGIFSFGFSQIFNVFDNCSGFSSKRFLIDQFNNGGYIEPTNWCGSNIKVINGWGVQAHPGYGYYFMRSETIVTKDFNFLPGVKYRVRVNANAWVNQSYQSGTHFLSFRAVNSIKEGPIGFNFNTNVIVIDTQVSQNYAGNSLKSLSLEGTFTPSVPISKFVIYSYSVGNPDYANQFGATDVTFDISSIEIVQDPCVYLPFKPIITGNSQFCAGQSTVLTASYGNNYLWSTGQTSQSIIVSNAGTYAVTVTNSNGCVGTSNYFDVTVNSIRNASITQSGNLCTDGAVLLNASRGTSYYWSTGSYNQSIWVYTSGTYFVTVNNNGCTSTTSYTLQSCNTDPCQQFVATSGRRPPCLALQYSQSSLDENPEASELTIFPNPAIDYINITLPSRVKEPTPISIFDVTGKQLTFSVIPIGEWKVMLSLETIPRGIYILNVGNGAAKGMSKKISVLK